MHLPQTLLPACIASLLLLAHPTQAGAAFKNLGTNKGWDGANEENKGTVEVDTKIFYSEPSSLKMTQVFDPDYDGRYHSEVYKEDVYKLGDSGAYGFRFRLDESWDFADDQSYNLAQFIADFKGSGCDDYVPTTMVGLKGSRLYTRLKMGSACDSDLKSFDDLPEVTAGEWHQVVLLADWRNDDTGSYVVWYDGKKVVDERNLATTVDEKEAFQFRVGLYANGWHDDKGMKGSQGTRTVWYDDIAVGSTIQDVSSNGLDGSNGSNSSGGSNGRKGTCTPRRRQRRSNKAKRSKNRRSSG
ncbi:hypothetical protein P168DRAFT_16421 [Aspergillus campestris IBT 28561]|uniref:Polysaccharide lyase n=1 Tax=Aspergillus campestris (strain IBT 28561) TaxID=1392248 RepID=A0A2I1DEX0_ASPC2|nr:uncharacterized protein P168DRAFT_16421 [Aspergillus campestris IBT 28561]PKY08425.1 hypothetical protein P168DRAFT_16421 [Aspergillus campestris IBT 28561]